MKKNKNIVKRTVCGAPFLIAEDGDGTEFNSLITLNETAEFLWDAMGDADISVDDLVTKLTAEYEVSADEARANICDLLGKMQAAGVIDNS